MGLNKLMLAAAAAILLSACGGDPAAPEPEKTMPEKTVTDKIMEVTVGPAKVDCAGVGPMKCLVVDGKMFYQKIDGFTFEEGFDYRLKIRQVQVHTPETAPADAGLYRYQLVELISKTPAAE